MNLTMTAREALEIQARQLRYYRRDLSRSAAKALRQQIAAKTTACGDLDAVRPMAEINEMVPRGCNIEWAVTKLRERELIDAARNSGLTDDTGHQLRAVVGWLQTPGGRLVAGIRFYRMDDSRRCRQVLDDGTIWTGRSMLSDLLKL